MTWPHYKYTREDLEKKVFYEYLITGDKMFAIVKQKHKEIAVKEAKTKKKEECVKTALA